MRLDDLPWLLYSWLPCGAAGVPADGLSHSQDFLVRLDDSNVIGVAVKAAGTPNGTSWASLACPLHRGWRRPPATRSSCGA